LSHPPADVLRRVRNEVPGSIASEQAVHLGEWRVQVVELLGQATDDLGVIEDGSATATLKRLIHAARSPVISLGKSLRETLT
jgi:hypothetical protein